VEKEALDQMPTPRFLINGLKLLKSNSPEILTALGVAGVVTTSYLAGKASFEASEIIRKEEDEGRAIAGTKNRFKEYGKLVWKCYIPPTISGVVTIGCVVGASKASSRRTAAAVTAYSLTQRAFDEYREKVVEQLGKGKDRKVRDELAQDHVTSNPPVSREVIITGKGNFLCREDFTGRYFRSDMETLRRAENQINYMIVHDLFVCLEEFYDLIGLPGTSESGKVGWNSDKLLELKVTTTLSEDDEPCLVFNYNYTKPLR
jgi:hypothetical protein